MNKLTLTKIINYYCYSIITASWSIKVTCSTTIFPETTYLCAALFPFKFFLALLRIFVCFFSQWKISWSALTSLPNNIHFMLIFHYMLVGCQGIGNPANYFKLIAVKYEATIEDHVELNCHCTSDSNNIGRVYDIYKSQTQLVQTSLRVFRLHIQSFISF